MGRNVEEVVIVCYQIISWHILEELPETMKELNKDRWSSDQD
jgi:hypothetical protein